jgi:hypothetical protein
MAMLLSAIIGSWIARVAAHVGGPAWPFSHHKRVS